MTKNNRVVHGVLHTHWDREWYFTDNEASVLLVYHMDEVIEELENGTIDYYTLDGQMSIVDDYLRVFPEKRAQLAELVAKGKLMIGPWYIQVDEFLTSGESYLRNLELGINMANDLGGSMNVGYLPDSFGQSQDIPKILNGFGIDSFIFWRGLYNPDKPREFYWSAPDGSRVLCSNIEEGYFEGRDIVEHSDDEQAGEIVKRNLKRSQGQHTLMPFGWDQRPVYRDLKAKLNHINKTSNAYDIIESTYDQYFDALKSEQLDLETRTGEFMYAVVSKIHRSIYSSRYDLKQLNDNLERKLTYVLEPLMTMLADKGISYKKELLDYIWKLVINNQAHDSLGACNSDKTNFNIFSRGKQALELTHSTIDYLMKKFVISDHSIAENELVIANPLPYSSQSNMTLEVTTKSKNFTLFNSQNEQLAFDVLDQVVKSSANVTRDKHTIPEADRYYITKLAVDFQTAPVSLSKLKVIEENGQLVRVIEATNDTVIENEYYALSCDNGQFTLQLKEQGTIIKDFISFIDDGDEGDNYDYSPAYQDQVYQLDLVDAEVSCKKGRLVEEMIVEGQWLLPLNLADRATDQCTTALPFKLIVRLNRHDKKIDVKINLTNTVKDHRLRCVLNSQIVSTQSHAGTQYGQITRENVDPYLAEWQALKWREEPTSLYPLLNYVNIHDEKLSLSAFTKGLKEYQVTGDQFNQIALTLFRSVGYLGRPDLIRRPGAASGTKDKYIATPDSQLLKELEFEFAIMLDSQSGYTNIYQEYLSYVQEFPYYQKQRLNKFFNPISYFMINENKDTLEWNHEALSFKLNDNQLVYSSFRLVNNQYELRIFNPTQSAIFNEEIEFNKAISYCETDLKNQLKTDWLSSTRKIIIDKLKPGEIKTFVIQR
ncbi:mannosylglycerate hydrolase [Amphibacillus marinus]|uniref:Mannosylglycerate hydrolase n=1 Tax=Amphibacillus marinus TaxID=872970 RepID=A0A1H8L9Z1_9BACI|nr:glycoside hydrolase family 38 C-terminal domain-containing protein [Amphibacillus marinus]SEO01901.1 mannosylglycerate hydrolase [Amphibacillus marinus]